MATAVGPRGLLTAIAVGAVAVLALWRRIHGYIKSLQSAIDTGV